MNLNKYHSTGRLYTKDEAHDRAVALLTGTYIAKGYARIGEMESRIKPYANETKRQERLQKSLTKGLATREHA